MRSENMKQSINRRHEDKMNQMKGKGKKSWERPITKQEPGECGWSRRGGGKRTKKEQSRNTEKQSGS